MGPRASLERVIVLATCVAALGCGGATLDASSSAPATDAALGDAAQAVDAAPDEDAPAEASVSPDAAPADAALDAGSTPDAPTPKPTGCVDAVSAGHHVFDCDGIAYDVTVPASCAAGGCGLVLDVHGMTMSARMEDANTGMRALGIEHGYVIVQPNANPAPPAASWTPGVDDAKVFAFLELALAAFAIDRDRVHMTGFSQGGMMTSRFLCDHADVFASVAPMAGTGCAFLGAAKPSREVHVLYAHGARDAIVAYATGTQQRNAMIAAWSMKEESVVSSDAKHEWKRYRSPSGTVLEFVRHDYEASAFTLRGHCYPGSEDSKGGAPGQLFGFACEGASAFTWGEIVMQFFRDHPRK